MIAVAVGNHWRSAVFVLYENQAEAVNNSSWVSMVETVGWKLEKIGGSD